ncbi:MAG: hypothetical protein G01um101418_510 [Parcubacteria group bacterium Gr01-1014_18]|nr:MAG: hypothetical protein Greene041636_556 [Parcubacteria group bacterium Greene0416_36]TSC80973.1 MAG: hypothetical protein G01um101418_510 [Parcubacteria group bacterium Gr01-1014_18]TSC98860.1 MAG: hypothetical protein Greene101420_493 [Parcubacteria group bacterium Greene1014_20]TSD06554.1 MAG: hypothetical protein Greene07142_829 [Parcubacteria group bacterium Greene0714_2]
MESLGVLLKHRIVSMPQREQLSASAVLEKFNELLWGEFGDVSRTRAKAIYLKNDILCVAVLSSPLGLEIKFREQKMIHLINDFCGRTIVGKLRIMG